MTAHTPSGLEPVSESPATSPERRLETLRERLTQELGAPCSAAGADAEAWALELSTRATRDDIADAWLAALALDIAEVTRLSQSHPMTLFDRVSSAALGDAEPVEQALAWLSSLEALPFCLGIQALLLIGCSKQRAAARAIPSWPATRVLAAVEAFPGELRLDDATNPALFAYLLLETNTCFPELDLSPLARSSHQHEAYLKAAHRLIQKHSEGLAPSDRLWQVLEPWIPRDEKGSRKGDAWEYFVGLQAASGDLEAALATLESLTDPYTLSGARALVVETLLRGDQIEAALALARQDVDYPWRPSEVLDIEVGRRLQAGELAVARRVAASMPDPGRQVHALAHTATAFRRSNRDRDALECLRAAVAAAEDSGTLGSILEGLLDLASNRGTMNRDLEATLRELCERAWQLAEEINLRRDQLAAKLQVVRTWLALGDLDRAAEAMESLEGASRVEALAASAVEKCHRGDAVDKAEERLTAALREARSFSSAWERGAALLAVAHASTAIVPERSGDLFLECFAAAREDMARTVRLPIPELSCEIFHALAKTCDFERRTHILFEALTLASEYQEPWRRSRFLIEAPVVLQRLPSDVAHQWIEHFREAAYAIEHQHERTEALISLASTLVAEGRERDASDMIERIEPGDQRVQARTLLAKKLWQSGEHEPAHHLLSAAATEARGLPGHRARDLLGEIIRGYLETGDLESALVLLRDLGPSKQTVPLGTALAVEALLVDARKTAIEALASMLPLPSAELEAGERRFTIPVVENLARALMPYDPGGTLRSEWMLAAIRDCGSDSDESRRGRQLVELAQIILEQRDVARRSGLLDKIARSIQQIETDWQRSSYLFDLAQKLVTAGEVRKARGLAETLGRGARYAKTLAKIAGSELASGSATKATELLGRALEQIAELEPPGSSQSWQSEMAPQIAASSEDARENLMEQATAGLRRIEPDTRRAYAMNDFGKALTSAALATSRATWAIPWIDRLMDWIREAEMSHYADELAGFRPAALARVGEFDEALACARAIDPLLWQHPEAIRDIVAELASRGFLDAAFSQLENIKPEGTRLEALERILAVSGGRDEQLRQHLPRMLELTAQLTAPGHWRAAGELLVSLARRLTLPARDGQDGTERPSPMAEKDEAAEQVLAESLDQLESRLGQIESFEDRLDFLNSLLKARLALGDLAGIASSLERTDLGDGALRTFRSLLEEAHGTSVEARRELVRSIRPAADDIESLDAYCEAIGRLAAAAWSAGLGDEADAWTDSAIELYRRESPVQDEGSPAEGSPAEGSPALRFVMALIPALDCGDPRLAGHVSALLAELSVLEEQVEALEALAQKLPGLAEVHGLDRILLEPWVRIQAVKALHPAWLSALTHATPIALETLRLLAARRSHLPELAVDSSRTLAAALLLLGRIRDYQAVAAALPQLGLPLFSAQRLSEIADPV